MIDVLAVLGALAAAAGTTAAVSATFFGNYREGFRIISAWMAEPDAPDPNAAERPASSLPGQLVFGGIILLVLIVGYPSFRYWLGRILPS